MAGPGSGIRGVERHPVAAIEQPSTDVSSSWSTTGLRTTWGHPRIHVSVTASAAGSVTTTVVTSGASRGASSVDRGMATRVDSPFFHTESECLLLAILCAASNGTLSYGTGVSPDGRLVVGCQCVGVQPSNQVKLPRPRDPKNCKCERDCWVMPMVCRLECGCDMY